MKTLEEAYTHIQQEITRSTTVPEYWELKVTLLLQDFDKRLLDLEQRARSPYSCIRQGD